MTKEEIISVLISIEASLDLGNVNDALVKTIALRRSLDSLGIKDDMVQGTLGFD